MSKYTWTKLGKTQPSASFSFLRKVKNPVWLIKALYLDDHEYKSKRTFLFVFPVFIVVANQFFFLIAKCNLTLLLRWKQYIYQLVNLLIKFSECDSLISFSRSAFGSLLTNCCNPRQPMINPARVCYMHV